jgi:beta-alanine--pyruvate transaminase
MRSTDSPAHADLGLDHYWMPFTANRYFQQHPKLITSAAGAYFNLADGRRVFDCLSGLWTTGLGHCHPKITETLRRQAGTLDFSPPFQLANPWAHQLANRIAAKAPEDLDRVFFTNSGSEAIDTAMKMALAYHRTRGEAGRTRFIGRERGYHGVGFGGISVGGMVANRKMFSPLTLNGVDHLSHTHNPKEMAFTKGQPVWGTHLADELERMVALHDASNIAAVIVEPVAGSTGVLVPPVGYLQRLRELCTKHGILLIFDEVIGGFGRFGENFSCQRLGVTPDLITFAKQITNGVVPMGGVIAREGIYQTFMNGPPHVIEFFHGYTYSGHPLAAAVGNTVLDIIEEEGLIERARSLEPVLEESIHALKGQAGILDIRNFGLAAAIDLEPIPGQPGVRGMRVLEAGLEAGMLYRVSGDTVAMGPPFISTPDELSNMCETLGRIAHAVPAA